MSSLKEIRELLVYFYNYDGVISDEKFVPLYGRNLVERFVSRKWMFVAPLRLFAIYVFPNFRTLHSSSLHSSRLEAVGLTYKNFFGKLNTVIVSPLHLH